MKWIKRGIGEYWRLNLDATVNLSKFKISRMRDGGFLDGDVIGYSLDFIEMGHGISIFKFKTEKMALFVLGKLIDFLNCEDENVFDIETILEQKELEDRIK